MDDEVVVGESVEGRRHHVNAGTQSHGRSLTNVATAQEKASAGETAADVTITREEARANEGSNSEGSQRRVVWMRLGQNVYGGFIYHAFEEGFLGWNGALVQYGPMVLAVFLAQTSIAYELHNSLPSPYLDSLCEQPPNLQIAATFVFLLVTLENVPNFASAAMICFLCKAFVSEVKVETEDAAALPQDGGSFLSRKANEEPSAESWGRIAWRFALFFCAVATELVAWFSVLAVGLVWLFSAESSEEIVRTTVSISFVNNIDELVYKVCVGPDFHAVHKAHKYKLEIHPVLNPFYKLIFWPRGRIYILAGMAGFIAFGVREVQMSCVL